MKNPKIYCSFTNKTMTARKHAKEMIMEVLHNHDFMGDYPSAENDENCIIEEHIFDLIKKLDKKYS